MGKSKQKSQTLGKDLLIKADTKLFRAEAGLQITYHDPIYEVIIPIGKDHTASLIMDEDAYFAFTNQNTND